MASQPDAGIVLEIKKYPNRRLYDATRSCHVTTGELYDLVAAGRTVRVRDSKSGEDITNQVLLQALIERDPLKINAVPPMLVHMMIRANQQLMASWFDHFLRWAMEGYREAGGASPAWWGAGWPGGRGAWPGEWAPPGWGAAGGPGGSMPSPMAWMESLFRPTGAPPQYGAGAAGFAEPPPPPEDHEAGEVEPPGPESEPGIPGSGADESGTDLDRLRQQVAALAEEIARLRSEREGGE